MKYVRPYLRVILRAFKFTTVVLIHRVNLLHRRWVEKRMGRFDWLDTKRDLNDSWFRHNSIVCAGISQENKCWLGILRSFVPWRLRYI